MVQSRPRPPELLAPAGSPEALSAAINAGADAVYLGGRSFGARMYAANFSLGEMAVAVSEAHLRGARVYVTLNILIHDRELPDVASYLCSLYGIGVDAVLVQDPGIAAMARDLVPDLPLHASTQCTICDADGLRWAKKAGYDRVVLARELPLAEIDRLLEIPPEERPEIEIFVHGALCYAYSGQCLLSSVIGGRSGNRGRCAQPCRKAYRLVSGMAGRSGWIVDHETVETPGAYLLSTKDLCTLAAIPELATRPFAALKIEGRMRSAEYVAITVSRYRRALDAVIPGRGSPDVLQDTEDMAVMFSRDFTGGYLSGDRDAAVMGRNRPDKQGLFIGRIAACSGSGLRILAGAVTIPRAGDGLVGIDPYRDERIGFVLRSDAQVEGPYLVIRQQTGCRPGMGVYLTRSLRLEREAKRIIHRQGPPGKVPLDIDLSLTFAHGHPPLFSGNLTLGNGSVLRMTQHGDFVPQIATGKPTSPEEIERQIRKTGKTVFRVREFSLSSPGDLFIPLGKLNQFRRDFLDAVEHEILSAYLPGKEAHQAMAARLAMQLDELSPIHGKREAVLPGLAVLCDDLAGAEAALAAGCHTVYLEPEPDLSSIGSALLPALESSCENGRIAWKWPHIVPPGFSEAVLPSLPALREAGLCEIMTESPGSADVLRRAAPGIRISGGTGLNVFNHRAVRALSGLFDSFTLSPELSGQDIAELSAWVPDNRTGISVIVQGSIEAMVTADTLADLVPAGNRGPDRRYGLVDQTGRVFPFHSDTLGRTRIFNAAELCLLDFLPRLAEAGVDRLLIDARWRGVAYARGMTSIYREALSEKGWIQGGPETTRVVARLKPLIRDLVPGGITSGPFLRGLCED
jgi:putative protease